MQCVTQWQSLVVIGIPAALISDIDTFLLVLFIVSLELKSKVVKVLFMNAVVL